MNLANLLLRTARLHPDRGAVSWGEQALFNYRQLAGRTTVLAGQMRQKFGLHRGDRVAIFMQNHPYYLEIFYAIWAAGLVAVPINNKLHAAEAAYIIDNSQSALIFTDSKLASALDTVDFTAGDIPVIDVETPAYHSLLSGQESDAVECVGDDLAWLFYTSGTTGKPKGVMLSHQNLLIMSLCYLSGVDEVHAQDSILYAAPMSHGAGMYHIIHTMMGAGHVIPKSGTFNSEEIFRLAQHHHHISMFAAPTMVRRMVEYCADSGADPTVIKTVVYGGGPMYVEDILRGLEVMGNRFVQIYGQGESPMTITSLKKEHLANRAHPRYLQRLGSVGVAQSAVDVHLVDQHGKAVNHGEVGEILVRGASVMQGYWHNPQASADTLRDGWLYTGDMGSIDEDGFVTLKDRSKDVIITGGSNVYPREVEEALLTHPDVAEVSVVGKPSQEWGEDIVAFIVTNQGADFDSASLDRHCLKQIARFKRPKTYIHFDKLPKNNYGKVLKTVLREYLNESSLTS